MAFSAISVASTSTAPTIGRWLSGVSIPALAGAAFALTPQTALAQVAPNAASGAATPTAQDQLQNQGQDQGQDIVVTGIRAAIARGLETKRNADSIVDSISAEDIGKLPDDNIAEAVQRIPGVSIDRSGGEGRHISINGLGPDFTLTLLNGRQIASSDESRSFSFDTIAASLVHQVNVYKTTNVNMPEGGLGGTIDVRTARPFDFPGFTASAQLAYQYNDLSRAGYPQGSFLVSDRFFGGKLGVLASFTHQKRHTTTFGTSTGAWSTNYFVDPITTEYVEDTREDAWRAYDIDYTRTEDYRERNGGTVAVQLAASDTLTLTADYLYSKFKVRQVSDAGGAYLWSVQDSAKTILTDHGLKQLDIGLQPGAQCVYPWDGITTPGHQCLGSYSWTHSSTVRPTTTQLAGFNAEWKPAPNFSAVLDAYWSKAVNSNTGQNTSDNLEATNMPEYLAIFPDKGGAPYFDTLGFDLSGAVNALRPRLLGNSGTDTRAVNKGVTADFDYAPADFLHVKAGAGWADQVKANTFYSTPRPVRALYWCCSTAAPPDLSVFDQTQYAGKNYGVSGDPFPIFVINEDRYRAWAADPANLSTGPGGHRTCPATSTDNCGYDEFVANGSSFKAIRTASSYRVEEKDLSLYGELDADFTAGGAPVNVVAGLRYSRTNLTSFGTNRVVIGFDGNSDKQLNPVYEGETPGSAPVYSPVSVTNTYEYFLPSLNFKVELNPEVIFRIGISRTMTRPTLDDISPSQTLSGFGFAALSRGGSASNPYLKPYTSNNIDASFEYYYSRHGAIAIAGFHKEASNFIVTTTDTETIDSIGYIKNVFNVDGTPSSLTLDEVRQFQITRPVNAASAVIDGLTASWTHSFDIGLGFQANYTKVWSTAKSSVGTFSVPGVSDTANLVGFYEKGPVSVRVAYNWRSAFVQSPGNEFNLPVTGAPYHQVDARVGFDIGHGVDLGFEMSNITNEKVRYYARYGDQFVSEVGYGREATVTISKKF